MAVTTTKLLINAADFPFTYEQASRSATQNQDIGPRLPGFFAGDQANFDFGQPQLIYCENVMPYAKGIMTVSYDLFFGPAFSPTPTNVDQVFKLVDENNRSYAFIPAGGQNWLYNQFIGSATTYNSFVFANSLVTTAEVEGRSYICYERDRILRLTAVGPALPTVTFTYPPGVTIADVRGIAAVGNYMVFFTDITIYWCSVLNVLDFSDIDQGAGNQIPTEITGSIVGIAPIPGGAIIYTTSCAIGMRFTNNAAAPFVFKAIPGVLGVFSIRQVAEASPEGAHYVFSAAGLLKVTLTQSVEVFPEATDFFRGTFLETWNSTLKKVNRVNNAGPGRPKVTLVNSRYLVLSYGISGGGITTPPRYAYALIHDIALGRWGKIKYNHCDVFSTSRLTNDESRICFLTTALYGNSLRRDLQQDVPNGIGVAVFGHFQERHDRMITMQSLTIDAFTFAFDPVPTVNLLGAETGELRTSVTPMNLVQNNAGGMVYASRVTAQNFDIAVEGSFSIKTILAKVQKHGYR